MHNVSSPQPRAVVVGAGMIGLTTAFELVQAGFCVTVIDPHPVSGATHHAGGMLAPAAEVVYQQDPLFPLMRAANALWPDLIRRVSAHTDLPTGYRDDGTLVLAADRADAQHLRELAEYQHLHGMEVESITVGAARRREPALSPRLAAAVSIPGDHHVFPRTCAAALRDALENLGVTFCPYTVTDISGNAITCTTAEGNGSATVLNADTIVLAAGLGVRGITGWYQGTCPVQLRPVYGDILRLQVPEHQRPLCTRVIRGFVEDRPVYIIPRHDDTIAIGATSREDGQLAPVVGGIYELLRDAIRLLPAIEECTFLEATAGARPGTPDDLPYLGKLSDNLIISTGYFRHGILLAAAAAQATAQLAQGLRPDIDISACEPLRHQLDQI